jgi:hypothetical protein
VLSERGAKEANNGRTDSIDNKQYRIRSRTELEAEQSARNSSSNGLAFVLHTIKLHETANGPDFEKFIIREIFPAVNTQKSRFKEMAPDQHFLLDGGNDGEYVWMIRMEYFIHQTPTPTWLSNRVTESYSSVKDKIEPFGTLVSTKLLYDIERWLRRLGVE